jgi:hypothetical protein
VPNAQKAYAPASGEINILWSVPGGDAEQGPESGMPGAAAVEAEDELVEVGLQMPAAQAVVVAQALDLEVGEDTVRPGAAILPTTWGSWLTPGAPGYPDQPSVLAVAPGARFWAMKGCRLSTPFLVVDTPGSSLQ